ncbi:Kef-type K+ transport system, membrane component [Thiovulum sp. ES]|nr:Kef-type K+ transport system, membrane component [Thiovulum sp. ES]
MGVFITFGLIIAVQILMFHFYRISGLLTGVLFGVIFGPMSLKLLGCQSINYMDSLMTISIFMLVFYLSLTKPGGEFVKRYVMQYKFIALPTILTMLVVYLVNVLYFENFAPEIGIILVLAFGIVSVSVNSIAMRYLKEQGQLKENVCKLFLAKALPNNFFIIAVFVTLISFYGYGDHSFIGFSIATGKTVLFLFIALAISRYVYPRIARFVKGDISILLLLLANALTLSGIAYLMEIHYIIAIFSSTLLIPEVHLKFATVEPIRKKVGILNGYLFVPIFGLAVGLNIDLGILFDYSLFIPFVILTITIWVAQYLFSLLTLRFDGIEKNDTKFITYGSFAKTELALIILLFSVSYGIIDPEIFTASVIVLAMSNLFAWHELHKRG